MTDVMNSSLCSLWRWIVAAHSVLFLPPTVVLSIDSWRNFLKMWHQLFVIKVGGTTRLYNLSFDCVCACITNYCLSQLVLKTFAVIYI